MPKTAAAKREWFKITNLAEEANAEILLYGYIGASNKPQYDWWSGAEMDGEAGTVREFQQQLDAIPSKRPVNVRIASVGGNAWDALAMHNMLARREGPVNVFIDGFAFSAATLVAMAGDTVEMPQNALFMMHEAEWVAVGNKSAMQSAVQSLEVMDTAIAKSYAHKSGGKVEDFLALMKAETWMDGDEAKRLGLVDVVTSAQTITAHFSDDIASRIPEQHRASFDTRRQSSSRQQAPQNSNPNVMLRPRTPLFTAVTDSPGAGGTTPAASAQTPAAVPAVVPAPTNVATPATPVVPAPTASAPAAAAPSFTLADVTNAVNQAVAPLMERVTNLEALRTNGAAAAAQGAPPVTNVQTPSEPGAPKPVAGDTPRERTVNAFKSLPVFGTSAK
jgi:ATP-dependent Clp protease, protease subunit